MPTELTFSFSPGQNVKVTRGGHMSETGTVRHIHHADNGQLTITVTLETGTLWVDDGTRMTLVVPHASQP